MEASLVPASPDGSRPYTDIHTATGKSARNWIEDLHDMQVEDICGKEELYKLDNTGFQYGREVAKHTSFKFLNDDEIEREYSESIDLIKRVTGATKLSSSITLFVAIAQAS
ncbi:hypothetical protein C8R48DRAFT_797413 [Suillus tomentosus]|nr:hypothetical protein C8R48DRAFT_797413 [Suillus tomentosus]